jgi:ABC-2 type transport system permease protein
MRIIHLALKDLSQIIRQKKSALFLLLMPLLFTWLMGVIFNQNGEHDPRLPVALVVFDDGVLGGYYETLLGNSDTIRPITPDRNDTASLEQLVRSQKAAAVIVIPAGFSERTLTNEPAQLTLIIDRNTPAGQAADRAIQLATTRLLGAVEAARLSTDDMKFSGKSERRVYMLESLTLAVDNWQHPRVVVSGQHSGIVSSGPGGFAQASSGMMVFFATIGMITPGYILLAERRSRTLARMLTTSLSRAEVIAGHTLAMFVISFVQVLLLTLFGQLAIGLDYWQNPAATLLMVSALALWSASFGLMISVVANDENQVVLFVLGSTLVFGLLGGAFFPLDLTGKTFAAFGHAMPSAWAIEGLQDIILRGAGIDTIFHPAGILLLYSICTYGLAVWRFHFEAAK